MLYTATYIADRVGRVNISSNVWISSFFVIGLHGVQNLFGAPGRSLFSRLGPRINHGRVGPCVWLEILVAVAVSALHNTQDMFRPRSSTLFARLGPGIDLQLEGKCEQVHSVKMSEA